MTYFFNSIWMNLAARFAYLKTSMHKQNLRSRIIKIELIRNCSVCIFIWIELDSNIQSPHDNLFVRHDSSRRKPLLLTALPEKERVEAKYCLNLFFFLLLFCLLMHTNLLSSAIPGWFIRCKCVYMKIIESFPHLFYTFFSLSLAIMRFVHNFIIVSHKKMNYHHINETILSESNACNVIETRNI